MNSDIVTKFIRRKELITEINVKRQEFIRINNQIEFLEKEKVNLLCQIQALVEQHSNLSDKLLEEEYNGLVATGQ